MNEKIDQLYRRIERLEGFLLEMKDFNEIWHAWERYNIRKDKEEGVDLHALIRKQKAQWD